MQNHRPQLEPVIDSFLQGLQKIEDRICEKEKGVEEHLKIAIDKHDDLKEEIRKKIVKKIKDAVTKEVSQGQLVMMEDIDNRVCFDLEKELNEKGFPTIHDDQRGTATVFAAAMIAGIYKDNQPGKTNDY